MRLKEIILFIGIVILLSGCGLGKEEPLWKSGMFSPDGKYYVYTFSVTTITGIQKRGGATTRQGFIANYLQVIDIATGEKLLKKPYKSKEMLSIQDVEGDYIWLRSLNTSQGIFSPALFSIASKKMKFDGKTFRKIYPNIIGQSASVFFKDTATGAVCIEGTDGRKYRINPETGKMSTVPGEFERIDDKGYDCYQTERRMEGISVGGDTRKTIIKKEEGITRRSQDDFIIPQFLTIERGGMIGNSLPTIYDNHFFVLSESATDSKKDRLLTKLHIDTLKTQWGIALPQGDQEMNNYDKERFFLQGNQLLISNSTNLLIVNADKGNLIQVLELYP